MYAMLEQVFTNPETKISNSSSVWLGEWHTQVTKRLDYKKSFILMLINEFLIPTQLFPVTQDRDFASLQNISSFFFAYNTFVQIINIIPPNIRELFFVINAKPFPFYETDDQTLS